MKSAREAAADVLYRIENEQAYSTLTLKSELKKCSSLTEKDAALITHLVYGVVERKITLDYNISQYLTSPLKKLHPKALTLLRIGAYQILFDDRIPDHAAVNESVLIAKKIGIGFASGMINAVLRKVALNGLALPEPSDAPLYLSVAYSCPLPLVNHFILHYGMENAKTHLSASVGARPLFIRCNTFLCSGDTLCGLLSAEGVKCSRTELPGCLILESPGDVTKLKTFQKGYFYVQDASSQMAALLLGAEAGRTVLDCCAAPGGKSFTAALQMLNTGKLYACDLYEHKTQLIRQGAERLGIRNISVLCMDAANVFQTGISADAVLCDVPCSGFGVIGRKPEIRYKDISSFSELPETQYAILCSGAQCVKPGGTLVYSTCTLNPAENEDVCDRFLAEHPAFTVSSDGFYRSKTTGRYINIFATPNGGDGFFAAKFERTAL